MTELTELLKLPVCLKCKDTKHVVNDPRLAVSSRYMCTACQIRWGGWKYGGFVIDMVTNENVTNQYFPDSKPYEMPGNNLVRERPERWWQ
jgi:hypothetical protein